MFEPVRRFFHSYRERDYEDNEVLATRRDHSGIYEVIYWAGAFEVFFRPFKKRYAYLLGVYPDLKRAMTAMSSAVPYQRVGNL